MGRRRTLGGVSEGARDEGEQAVAGAGEAGSGRALPHPAVGELLVTEVLAALADPARLAIVRELAAAEAPGLSCEAVGGALGREVPKSTRSHQLKVLREAGVVRTTPAGRQRLVTLRADDLERRFPGLLGAVLRGAGGAGAAGAPGGAPE